MMDTGNEKTYSIASSECVSHLRVIEWARVGSEYRVIHIPYWM